MVKEYLWQIMLFGIICYFYSNFNFSVFISTHFKDRDIRTEGSGNPGTTNMFRVFGIKTGLLTFICDCMKGVIAALGGLLIFRAIANDDVAMFAAYFGGLLAGLGHVFPVFYSFKGGKGVATGIGIFLVVDPIFSLMAIAVGLVILLITDRMSIFALFFFLIILMESAIKLLPDDLWMFIFTLLYCALVVYAHRSNLKRLYNGTENPMGISKIFKK